MTAITFEISGTPIAKARPRFTTRGGFARAYTPKATRLGEIHIAGAAARHAPPEPHSGPVSVQAVVCLPVPASWPRRRREAALEGAVRPTSKPDLDNYVKALLDGITLTRRWWGDDSQVVHVSAHKRYAERAHTLVTITLL